MKHKILLLSANYYKEISRELCVDAYKTLKDHGNTVYDEMTVIPGVFEIPVLISRNIEKYDGFVALGCVIKGETPHFDFISRATTDAIMNLSITYKKPVGNGILTCLNYDQAKSYLILNIKFYLNYFFLLEFLSIIQTNNQVDYNFLYLFYY